MADEEIFESQMDSLMDETQEEEYIDGEFAKKARKRKQPCRKITDEWDDEIITKLISEVGQHCCLWDARDLEYKNKVSRENA